MLSEDAPEPSAVEFDESAVKVSPAAMGVEGPVPKATGRSCTFNAFLHSCRAPLTRLRSTERGEARFAERHAAMSDSQLTAIARLSDRLSAIKERL